MSHLVFSSGDMRKIFFLFMFFLLFPDLSGAFILQAQQGSQKEANEEANQKAVPVITKDDSAQKTTGQDPDKARTNEKKPTPEENMDTLLQRELEETSTRQPQTDKTRPSWSWQFLKTIFTLSILLFVFWGIWKIYFFKKTCQ